MSLHGYKKKWPRRSYLGPAAEEKNAIAEKAAELFGFKVVATKAKMPKGVIGMLIGTDENGNVDPRRSVVLRGPSPTTLARRAKKRRRDRWYNVKREEFLQRAENRRDMVAIKVFGKLDHATHVHHIRGRYRTLLFDERFWLPTGWHTNLWPHQNIERARELGLIAQDGDWNREPKDEETKRIKAWMQEKGIW